MRRPRPDTSSGGLICLAMGFRPYQMPSRVGKCECAGSKGESLALEGPGAHHFKSSGIPAHGICSFQRGWFDKSDADADATNLYRFCSEPCLRKFHNKVRDVAM
ncbi:unnamed protein product [Cylindrotheca closterium]|uniref:Uncharacterized protein n=1 Tax=Cylindrotheca closterium TaxID=2856 RepID=A0AAD2CTL8_9STRA|nr:unnamed protein product [Cylindrotheca closterium]